MRSTLIAVGFVLLAFGVIGFEALGEESEAITGKIVETFQEETGATTYRYEYDLAPEVLRSIHMLSGVYVEPVILVHEGGNPHLFLSAMRTEKEDWFFLDSATLLLGMKSGETIRISFGCENLDDDILYAYEFRDVLDNAKVAESVMVQLTPSPFGDKELDAIRNADTMQIVLYGKRAPIVLKSGTGQWQVFFDPNVWRIMVSKYDELLDKGNL